MIAKLPPVGFKILQISLQIMHHFLSRLCWPLLKVHFSGHAHLKLGCGNVGHRLGMWVTGYELSTRPAPSPLNDLTVQKRSRCQIGFIVNLARWKDAYLQEVIRKRREKCSSQRKSGQVNSKSENSFQPI